MARRSVPVPRRRGIHATVVDALGRRIIGGELREDDLLDLAALEEEFAVSHTAMREAIKVLTTKHLLDARPKRGTYVLPMAAWNLLDADVMTWRGDDPRLLRELEEVRTALEPTAARLAAERATPAQLAEIRGALQAMTDAVAERSFHGASTVEAETDADLQFHEAIGAAAGNALLERFERLLAPALRRRNLRTLPHSDSGDFLDEHRAVLDAIAARQPDEAQSAMMALLRHAAHDSGVA